MVKPLKKNEKNKYCEYNYDICKIIKDLAILKIFY